MDKKSGVYYSLTDNSLRAVGASAFSVVVPMYTTKGEQGKLITVTARNFRDLLGYDLRYNPNYAGLERMLSSVARLDVLRLNLNPKIGYKIWNGITGEAEPYAAFSSPDAVEMSAYDNSVWVSLKSNGSWGDGSYVAFSKAEEECNYILYDYTVDSGSVSLIASYKFSTKESDSNYYKNINFGDLVFGFKGTFPTSSSFFINDPLKIDPSTNRPYGYPIEDKYKLYDGSNGDKATSGSDIIELLHVLDVSPANVLVMNGFIENPELSEDMNILQTIVEYCGKQDKSVLLDAPDLVDPDTGILKATSLFSWSDQILGCGGFGHYAQVAARPDMIKIGGLDILIKPSVFLFQIYARMFSNFQHVNFVPAGTTYGLVSASNLMPCDFHLYGDELKTKRINYITQTSLGACMWEYRTLYAQSGSDLSYANTPFILRDLKARLVSFMENFTFSYTTPMDLLSIQNGLSSIFEYFTSNYFLVNVNYSVPSFEEAQAMGRELPIDINVAVVNSADVITLRVNLRNAGNFNAV